MSPDTPVATPFERITAWSRPWRRRRPLGEARGWADEQALERLGGPDPDPAAALASLFEARPTTWLRRMPGRETFPWPDADGRAVAKRYLGDEPAEAWAALVRPGFPRSPGRREGENLLALAADGLPVPRAWAWWEEPNPAGGPIHRFARSAVLMERVVHRASLRDLGREQPLEAVRAWLQPLAQLVARLHGLGWYHRDLYLQHIVLAEGEGEAPRLVLLDVGRARRERSPRKRWFVKDLAALLHSTPPGIDRSARLRFLAHYARERGLGRAERRSLARAVRLKAHRMAAHAPRHIDPAEVQRGGDA
jgi:tRNA A-37 threonylcarbamoyl transferase component Bud32